MAVTVTKSPTSVNAAYTDLIFEVSGSVTTSNPNYAYVLDIERTPVPGIGTRITQIPNPDGTAQFNVGQIIQGFFGPDPRISTPGITWDPEFYISASGRLIDQWQELDWLELTFKFGEQYSTGSNDPVIVYDNLTSVDREFFRATVDPITNRNVVTLEPSTDFQSQSYQPGSPYAYPGEDESWNTCADLTSVPYVERDPFFADRPLNQPIRRDQYATKSYLKQDWQLEDVFGATTASFFGVDDYSNFTIVDFGIDPSANGTSKGIFQFGTGPQNLLKGGTTDDAAIEAFFSSSWSYYAITARATYVGPIGTVNGPLLEAGYYNPCSVSASYWTGGEFTLMPVANGNENPVQFVFRNKQGVWDYYNAYNPLARQSNITRQKVTLPQVDYSSTVSTYDVNKRGETDYFTDKDSLYTLTTDYLDKRVANFIEELLESPDVFIYTENGYIPIIITNSEYTHNNSTGRNKLFQYTIEYKLSKGNSPDMQFEVDYRPTPTPTPPPTPTPTPTVTPTPTPTPTPSPTPTPLPTTCTTDSMYGASSVANLCPKYFPSLETVYHDGTTDITDATLIWEDGTCTVPRTTDRKYSYTSGGTMQYWSWDASSQTLVGPLSWICA